MRQPTQAAELARLSALLEGMDERAKEDRAARIKSEDEARKTRKELAERLAAIESVTGTLSDRMKEAEKVTAMVTSWRFMAMGALGLLGLLGGAIVTFLKWLGITLPGNG